MSEQMTFERAAKEITSLVASTKATYGEAAVSRDKEWQSEVAAQLSILYTLCKTLGIEYGPKVVGKQ
jgi:hypothetical protein